MENRINKVMVFAPHMDDEVIGCGGSILKHIGAGREVVVVFLLMVQIWFQIKKLLIC